MRDVSPDLGRYSHQAQSDVHPERSRQGETLSDEGCSEGDRGDVEP